MTTFDFTTSKKVMSIWSGSCMDRDQTCSVRAKDSAGPHDLLIAPIAAIAIRQYVAEKPPPPSVDRLLLDIGDRRKDLRMSIAGALNCL